MTKEKDSDTDKPKASEAQVACETKPATQQAQASASSNLSSSAKQRATPFSTSLASSALFARFKPKDTADTQSSADSSNNSTSTSTGALYNVTRTTEINTAQAQDSNATNKTTAKDAKDKNSTATSTAAAAIEAVISQIPAGEPLPLPAAVRAEAKAKQAKQQADKDNDTPRSKNLKATGVQQLSTNPTMIQKEPRHQSKQSADSDDSVMRSRAGHSITATAMALGQAESNASFKTMRYEAVTPRSEQPEAEKIKSNAHSGGDSASSAATASAPVMLAAFDFGIKRNSNSVNATQQHQPTSSTSAAPTAAATATPVQSALHARKASLPPPIPRNVAASLESNKVSSSAACAVPPAGPRPHPPPPAAQTDSNHTSTPGTPVKSERSIPRPPLIPRSPALQSAQTPLAAASATTSAAAAALPSAPQVAPIPQLPRPPGGSKRNSLNAHQHTNSEPPLITSNLSQAPVQAQAQPPHAAASQNTDAKALLPGQENKRRSSSHQHQKSSPDPTTSNNTSTETSTSTSAVATSSVGSRISALIASAPMSALRSMPMAGRPRAEHQADLPKLSESNNNADAEAAAAPAQLSHISQDRPRAQRKRAPTRAKAVLAPQQAVKPVADSLVAPGSDAGDAASASVAKKSISLNKEQQQQQQQPETVSFAAATTFQALQRATSQASLHRMAVVSSGAANSSNSSTSTNRPTAAATAPSSPKSQFKGANSAFASNGHPAVQSSLASRNATGAAAPTSAAASAVPSAQPTREHSRHVSVTCATASTAAPAQWDPKQLKQIEKERIQAEKEAAAQAKRDAIEAKERAKQAEIQAKEAAKQEARDKVQREKDDKARQKQAEIDRIAQAKQEAAEKKAAEAQAKQDAKAQKSNKNKSDAVAPPKTPSIAASTGAESAAAGFTIADLMKQASDLTVRQIKSPTVAVDAAAAAAAPSAQPLTRARHGAPDFSTPTKPAAAAAAASASAVSLASGASKPSDASAIPPAAQRSKGPPPVPSTAGASGAIVEASPNAEPASRSHSGSLRSSAVPSAHSSKRTSLSNNRAPPPIPSAAAIAASAATAAASTDTSHDSAAPVVPATRVTSLPTHLLTASPNASVVNSNRASPVVSATSTPKQSSRPIQQQPQQPDTNSTPSSKKVAAAVPVVTNSPQIRARAMSPSIADDVASFFDAQPVFIELFFASRVPQYEELLAKGAEIKKHGRSGAPKQRLVYTEPKQHVLFYSSSNVSKPPKEHSLAHAVNLLQLSRCEKGKASPVWQRAPTVPESKCISLADPNRELNIECASMAQRDLLFEAIVWQHQTKGKGRPPSTRTAASSAANTPRARAAAANAKAKS